MLNYTVSAACLPTKRCMLILQPFSLSLPSLYEDMSFMQFRWNSVAGVRLLIDISAERDERKKIECNKAGSINTYIWRKT